MKVLKPLQGSGFPQEAKVPEQEEVKGTAQQALSQPLTPARFEELLQQEKAHGYEEG